VAVTVSGVFDTTGGDPEATVDLATRVSRELEDLAAALGAERVHSASDLHMFVAGLGAPDPAVGTAARFAVEAGAAIGAVAQELDADVGFRAGISAGDVVSGLLDVDKLTYSLFGDPPRTALRLNAIAGPNQILVDEHAATLLGADWDLQPATGLIDLHGETVAAQMLRGGRPRQPTS
jgi:class 3 adenylate cyclase